MKEQREVKDVVIKDAVCRFLYFCSVFDRCGQRSLVCVIHFACIQVHGEAARCLT